MCLLQVRHKLLIIHLSEFRVLIITGIIQEKHEIVELLVDILISLKSQA